MRKKVLCQRCGRTHQFSSLRKEIHGERLLCHICYKRKNDERLNKRLKNLPEINNNSVKLPINSIYTPQNRPGEFLGGYLSKGEGDFLKSKYGYDSFKNGKGKFEPLERIKRVLRIKKKKIVKEHKTDLNEKFLEGLPQ